jgi:hypothetical protein
MAGGTRDLEGVLFMQWRDRMKYWGRRGLGAEMLRVVGFFEALVVWGFVGVWGMGLMDPGDTRF